MHLKLLLARTGKTIIDQSPTICMSIGVVGTITTAYLTGKASFKAARILAEEPEDNSLKENLSHVWKLYVPPVLSCTVTVGAIVLSHRIGARRAAGLAAAYQLSERAYSEYRTKVADQLGAKKDLKVLEGVQQDRVASNSEVVFVADGEVLFFDSLSGRYFKNTYEGVRAAVNDINFRINNHMYASLTDFYNLIGLPQTAYSEEVGWNADKLLEVEFSGALTNDNKSCIAVTYNNVPIRGYSRLC